MSGSVVQTNQLIADETIHGLTVSIWADVLSLLLPQPDKYGISLICITHDLATDTFITGRVGQKYLGMIVRIGPTDAVLSNPYHSYTKAISITLIQAYLTEGRDKC